MFIDTHCHLDYFEHISPILNQASQQKVMGFLAPATHLSSAKALLALSTRYPAIHVAVGVHPCEVTHSLPYDSQFADTITCIADLLDQHNPAIVAIGECGLDYKFDSAQLPRAEELKTIQLQLFKQHCEWATKYSLPLIIHNRNANEAVIATVERYRNAPLKGVLHCFAGSKKFARLIMDLGFYIGIGGLLTLDQGLQAVVKTIPLESIVLETDAPYLTPLPTRNTKPWPNEPANLPVIARLLAEIKGVTTQTVAQTTTTNAQKLFSLPDLG